ncbi:hypothetical protein E2C06_18360 [Dankookia rubra]|uniref:Transposase IS701-like DDE domain-containing protein n=1 Tax=Dankookia rubra TaxID=1442381 RepID=A0A4R5QDD3_9PROT|nr:transposase [Dankookia rubra]TDH61200.1 hypothetical protein E2C06_18360 [Dankookia rubra]
MPRLPARFAAVILCFAPLFQQRSWRHAQVLLVGAILAPGRRTVTSILRITGRSQERRFVNYHRILNRAAWSGRAAARVLLGLLVDAFVPAGPVLLGLDDTIERRRGKRISAKILWGDEWRQAVWQNAPAHQQSGGDDADICTLLCSGRDRRHSCRRLRVP